MFFKETLEVFDIVKALYYSNNMVECILPYEYSNDAGHSLRIESVNGYHGYYQFTKKLSVPEHTVQSVQKPLGQHVHSIPNPITNTNNISISGGIAFNTVTTPQRYTIKVKVDRNLRTLLSVDWYELKGTGYFINSNGTAVATDGNLIASALYLGESTIVDGVLYGNDSAEAFLKDVASDDKISILSLINLRKDADEIFKK